MQKSARKKTRQIREDIDHLLDASARGDLADGELARLKGKIINETDELRTDISRFRIQGEG